MPHVKVKNKHHYIGTLATEEGVDMHGVHYKVRRNGANLVVEIGATCEVSAADVRAFPDRFEVLATPAASAPAEGGKR